MSLDNLVAMSHAKFELNPSSIVDFTERSIFSYKWDPLFSMKNPKKSRIFISVQFQIFQMMSLGIGLEGLDANSQSSSSTSLAVSHRSKSN